MKKKILITSFDLEVGGVERSLIGLLENIDYSKYDVDLMLYRHQGGFLPLLPKGPSLLREVPEYSTFRKSINQILQERNYPITMTRITAKYIGNAHGKIINSKETDYLKIQYGWILSLPYLPKIEKKYDVAISFLWPHYFICEKVNAAKKIGWIHTDYTNIAINKFFEKKMWSKIDRIVTVSDGCKESFIRDFPDLNNKVSVIENLISPEFIINQAKEDISNEITKIAGRTTLVTVGRLSYAKGIDIAVHACKLLTDKGFDIEWYVVGYGPQEEEIKKLISKLRMQDRFKLLGMKTNPYPYIKAGDIYVQPSRYEGKAVTVREAQILEKPVLITNFPTAKSQVDDGIDGHITEQGIDGVVKGVIDLITNKKFRDELIKNTKHKNYGNQNEMNKLYKLI